MQADFLLLDNLFAPQERLCSIPLNMSVKGKAIPLQAWTVPKGSRKLRLPDFKTVGS
jgi:hypothetical protein